MKVSYKWLKEYVPLTCHPEEVAHELTMLGFEVEAVRQITWNFQNVVVGLVKEVVPLSVDSRLSLCSVDVGDRTLKAVCGAPNVASKQFVPFAFEGARLTNGATIERRNFGDVTSQGMICSEAELGLSARGDGIMVLEGGAKPGDDLKEWLGPEDYIFELNVTPNRTDCLCMTGVARELAVKYNLPLRMPAAECAEFDGDSSDFIAVELEDLSGCPRYLARYLSQVTIGPSPWWLVHRLESVGMRSINNVVDITNFVMMELGQPLHAFDYTLIAGGKIVVKPAVQGDHFVTLDGNTHTLRHDTLMICDGVKAIAIAGVMGGQNSEVTAETSEILLESAYFDPLSIRRTSKHLGISTESSYRFERGIDPNGVRNASERATKLMCDICGARATGGIDIYHKKIGKKKITLRKERLNALIGAEIPESDTVKLLTGLGCEVKNSGHYTVEVPTNRPDILREVDVIEEVARTWSYDNIPANTSVTLDLSRRTVKSSVFQEEARQGVLHQGYFEILTLTLLNPAIARRFLAEGEGAHLLKNPLSEEMSALRPSIIPGLLQVCAYNRNRGVNDLRIFEIGHCFAQHFSNDGVHSREWEALAAVMMGAVTPKTWMSAGRECSLFDLKGDIVQICEMCRLPELSLRKGEHSLFNSGGMGIFVRDTKVGMCGELSDEVVKAFEIEDRDIFAFEIDLSCAATYAGPQRQYRPVPKFPPALRDLSFVVDQRAPVGDMLQAIRTAGSDYLHEVRLADLFKGSQIPEGKKSLTFSLVFLNKDRTMRDEEVESTVAAIIRGLAEKFEANLRTV